jgi:1-pyrroline-5-carboxylate dehydrogenase
MSPSARVTYATLAAAQTEDFRRRYDDALVGVRAFLGGRYGHMIDGKEVSGSEETLDRSPIDTRVVLGRFSLGTPEHVAKAVDAAHRAFPDWSRRPWAERVAVVRRAADLVEERGFELSALVGLEAGKSRLEPWGRDPRTTWCATTASRWRETTVSTGPCSD